MHILCAGSLVCGLGLGSFWLWTLMSEGLPLPPRYSTLPFHASQIVAIGGKGSGGGWLVVYWIFAREYETMFGPADVIAPY